MQPVFAGLKQGEGTFPLAETAGRRVISLPMHPYLGEDQQAQVVRALREAVLS
jgi:UDP-2-acetamido-2-deoxy-ribo-hexuluronate aminotransferase